MEEFAKLSMEARWKLLDAIHEYGRKSRALGRAMDASPTEWAAADRAADLAHQEVVKLIYPNAFKREGE